MAVMNSHLFDKLLWYGALTVAIATVLAVGRKEITETESHLALECPPGWHMLTEAEEDAQGPTWDDSHSITNVNGCVRDMPHE